MWIGYWGSIHTFLNFSVLYYMLLTFIDWRHLTIDLPISAAVPPPPVLLWLLWSKHGADKHWRWWDSKQKLSDYEKDINTEQGEEDYDLYNKTELVGSFVAVFWIWTQLNHLITQTQIISVEMVLLDNMKTLHQTMYHLEFSSIDIYIGLLINK